MRRLVTIGCVALACAAAHGSELPEAWRHWRYSRAIVPDAEHAAPLARVTLPPDVLGRAQAGLGDLRVLDDAGGEVPFLVVARTGRTTDFWRVAALSDSGFVPGRYTEVTADTGTEAELHNAAELEIAGADFFAWVEIAASENRREWRIVRDRAPVYRFARDGLEGTRSVTYPDTRARWLRLRVLEPDRDLRITRVRIARRVDDPPELVRLPADFRRDDGSGAGRSEWVADLGFAHVPASTVRCSTSRDPFHRPLSVATSDDAREWREVGRGEIYRHGSAPGADGDGDAGRRSQLEVRFPEARGRYWRVTVHDRNDPPIEDLGLELRGTPRHVVFRAAEGREYRLVYGHARAEAPSYELARLTPREEAEAAPRARLGEEVANAAWVSPEPWTERHPVVLWLALGLAVLVLGWLALRALR